MRRPTDDDLMRDRLIIRGEDVTQRPNVWAPYERTETMEHYWRMEADQRRDCDDDLTDDYFDDDDNPDEDADRHAADLDAYCDSL